MKTLTLATMPLDERHTGANIATWLEEVVAKFNISKHNWVSVRCAGHTLQLIVNSSLKDTSISKALGAARTLVEHFKRSELANTKLKEKQHQMNTPEHKLIQDVSTRWNSTYFMVERLLEQRWPITATLSDPEVTPRGKHYFDLKPDQWSLLEELTQGLQPFQCATEFLSGQEYATLSCLPQLAKGLQRSVQQSLRFETAPGKAFLTNASKELTERWGSFGTFFKEKDNKVLLSAALDPRFRKLYTVEVLAMRSEKESWKPTEEGQHQGVIVPRREGESALENLLQSDTDSLSEEEESHEDQKIQMVRKEVQMYFSESQIPKQEDPLGWWKENEGRFPSMSKLARSFLCIPATSTPAERIFSAAGNICSQKRASLSSEHVDMLTFLHFNSALN
ncbi:putative zinc finger BED domain-containing protein 1-like [Triplophysa rosa]|uniref:Zinc finger BED domain-containing protein 1-like n=1 Tax=Triplophysa rosa TaxID=992332 RepID=A0A9W7TJD8_TRIRA|nr:putative zinc finger BED domain-containing protein 1-like [Triplophysa rosa]